MVDNARIIYATQYVSIKDTGGTDTAVSGVQSVGMNVNISLTPTFQLGELEVYELQEDTPEVDVTIDRILDGSAPAYLIATSNATKPTLIERANQTFDVKVGIYDDTTDSVGTSGLLPLSQVDMTGMRISSLNYNFTVGDNFSESVTAIGNDRRWYNITPSYVGMPTGNPDLSPGGFNGSGPLSGINRREDILFTSTSLTTEDNTVLPGVIYGLDGTGGGQTNLNLGAHIQSIGVSVDLSREDLFHLGERTPYDRVATFPVQTTTTIEVIDISGDLISVTEAGVFSVGAGCNSGTNVQNHKIRIAICEGLRIYMGDKNKLAGVSRTGGDAGGGNATVTYTFNGYNTFNVLHVNDPNTALRQNTTTNNSLYLGATD